MVNFICVHNLKLVFIFKLNFIVHWNYGQKCSEKKKPTGSLFNVIYLLAIHRMQANIYSFAWQTTALRKSCCPSCRDVFHSLFLLDKRISNPQAGQLVIVVIDERNSN